ncbi:MAG: amino acid ABC transporter substrate-binding protein [Chloroflexi bacterium]|nr:MAG: amino acid ABC transporter substrate-binding protein [Chloroflexota bacterium]
MNRRQLLMGASLALFLASCAAPAPAAEPAAAKPNDLGGREIVIAVENAYPPFNYKDEKTGENIGMDYDIVNDVCKRLNCKTKFVTTSWDAIVAVMESKGKAEWDMAADGITITPERAKNVDFSDPVINVAQRLLVRKGETRFKTGDEFKANAELIFGAQPGTTNYVIMEKLVGKDRIQAYDQFGLIVQALMNNDIDATVMDDVASSGNMQANPDKLETLAEVLAGEDLGFVFPQGSDLRAAFNKALADQRADGTFDKIKEKWIPGSK